MSQALDGAGGLWGWGEAYMLVVASISHLELHPPCLWWEAEQYAKEEGKWHCKKYIYIYLGHKIFLTVHKDIVSTLIYILPMKYCCAELLITVMLPHLITDWPASVWSMLENAPDSCLCVWALAGSDSTMNKGWRKVQRMMLVHGWA